MAHQQNQRHVSASTSRSVITNMPGTTHIQQNPAQQREKRIRLSNTYETSPRRSFPQKKVHHIIKEILNTVIGEEEYNAEKCKKKSVEISSLVKTRVRQLGCPRYKIVCTVTLGQTGKNCVKHVSRCIWNPSHDTFVEEHYENKTTFAVVCVYAIYTD